MRIMKEKLALTIFTLLLFLSPCQTFSETEKTISTDKYTFKIANSWTRATKSEERQIEEMMTKALQGIADANNFFVFQSPKGYMVVIYDVTFRQNKPTLKEGMEANKMNFIAGKERGIVRTVISNKIIEITGKKVLENDWVGTTKKRNNRNVTYIFNAPYKNVNMSVLAFFANDDAAFLRQMKKVISTFNFEPQS